MLAVVNPPTPSQRRLNEFVLTMAARTGVSSVHLSKLTNIGHGRHDGEDEVREIDVVRRLRARVKGQEAHVDDPDVS